MLLISQKRGKFNESKDIRTETYFLSHFRTFFPTKYWFYAVRDTTFTAGTMGGIIWFSTLDVLDTRRRRWVPSHFCCCLVLLALPDVRCTVEVPTGRGNSCEEWSFSCFSTQNLCESATESSRANVSGVGGRLSFISSKDEVVEVWLDVFNYIYIIKIEKLVIYLRVH